jgi:hypothetical protein
MLARIISGAPDLRQFEQRLAKKSSAARYPFTSSTVTMALLLRKLVVYPYWNCLAVALCEAGCTGEVCSCCNTS